MPTKKGRLKIVFATSKEYDELKKIDEAKARELLLTRK